MNELRLTDELRIDMLRIHVGSNRGALQRSLALVTPHSLLAGSAGAAGPFGADLRWTLAQGGRRHLTTGSATQSPPTPM